LPRVNISANLAIETTGIGTAKALFTTRTPKVQLRHLGVVLFIREDRKTVYLSPGRSVNVRDPDEWVEPIFVLD
jgi:hypothetical protein